MGEGHVAVTHFIPVRDDITARVCDLLIFSQPNKRTRIGNRMCVIGPVRGF